MNFLRRKREQKEAKKQEEVARRRAQLIAEARERAELGLAAIREIASNPPKQGKINDAHRFRYNVFVYDIHRRHIEENLRKAGITLEDIGTSREELHDIYLVAIKADIMVDAGEFGLVVTDATNQDG